MPKEKEKASTSPSPGFLQRIFGSSQLTPEMEQGIAIAKKEQPNLAPVQPYGFWSRMLLPGGEGYTSPGKTIYLNPAQMAGHNPQEVADTLIHEQTHVNQMNRRGLLPVEELGSELYDNIVGPSYSQRPDEMEAYQAEIQRRNRMKRMQAAVPSFETGQFYMPGTDINLPNPAGPSPALVKSKIGGR